MFSIQSCRVRQYYLCGPKLLLNWLLLTSNVALITGKNVNETVLSSQPLIIANSSSYQHTTESYEFNAIETQIKRFLNVHPANKSIDHVIRNSFNVDNPNPMYIFVLPGSVSGEKNRTLVLTRNNFHQATYPNISTGRRFVKDDRHANKLLKLFDKSAFKDKQKESDVDNFIFDFKDLDEAESMRIVAENVRTERNFIEFMERLNENGNLEGSAAFHEKKSTKAPVSNGGIVNKEYEDLVSPKLKYKFAIDYSRDALKPTTQNSVRTTELDWKDLGLDGWLGGLREPGKDFDTIVTE